MARVYMLGYRPDRGHWWELLQTRYRGGNGVAPQSRDLSLESELNIPVG